MTAQPEISRQHGLDHLRAVVIFLVVVLVRTDNWPPWKKFLSKPEAALTQPWNPV